MVGRDPKKLQRTESQNEENDPRQAGSTKRLINKQRHKIGEENREEYQAHSSRGHSEAKYIRVKTDPKDYVGLQNPGNTCYLNALLQCLYLTPEFRDKFSSDVNQTYPVYSAINEIFCALDRRNRAMNSFKVNEYLGLPSAKQQDVPEVFQLLLNTLDSESTKGLHFKEVFKATLVNLTHCTTCDTKDGLNTGNGIVVLPLAVLPRETTEEHWSVAKALDQFLREDNMTGDNQIYCSTCSMKTDTTLRQTFTSLPRILVVQLKRFEYDFYINKFVKLGNVISINMNLKVPCETATHSEKKLYELFAVCDHDGGIYGGHYTALIKPIGSVTWHRFNDSLVITENLQEKRENKMSRSDDYRILQDSETAYLLMYRQRSDSAPKKNKISHPYESPINPGQTGEEVGGQPIRRPVSSEQKPLLKESGNDSRSNEKTGGPGKKKIRNTEPQDNNMKAVSELPGGKTNMDLPENEGENRQTGNRWQRFGASVRSRLQSCFHSCFHSCFQSCFQP